MNSTRCHRPSTSIMITFMFTLNIVTEEKYNVYVFGFIDRNKLT